MPEPPRARMPDDAPAYVAHLECFRGGRWRGRESCTSWAWVWTVQRALERRGYVVHIVVPGG